MTTMSNTQQAFQGKVEILKAKLKKGIKLEAEYLHTMPDGTVNSHSVKCKHEAHDDLRRAFKVLGVHLGYVAEQFDKKGEMKTEDIFCRSWSKRGEDENEGITLSGYRTLTNGKAFNFNAPFLKFESDYYQGMDALQVDLEKCENEVILALFENKKLPDNQMSLFPEHEEDEDNEADDQS